MTMTSRGEKLMLKAPLARAPVPAQVADRHPVPAPRQAKQAPPPDPPRWLPGRTADELRAQLPELLTTLHPVFLLGVVPLALGAGPALVEVARPGCRQRVRRWTRAWVSSEAYLSALAAEGAMRHDRRGVAVEPVDPEHQAEARRRLAWLASRRQGEAA
jgi:hypothetical protein